MSEEFRQSVTEMTPKPEADGWRFYSWHKTVVPDHVGTIIQIAAFVHQEGRDRLDIYHDLSDTFEKSGIILHAWLPDGTVLRTSNENAFPVMNPKVEWDQRPRAESSELIKEHFAKSASRGAIAFADPEEMEQRLIELNLESYKWLHAKGIYGPMEPISA
jgi:hypothetical protein